MTDLAVNQNLKYPVFMIEDRGQEYSQYSLIRSQRSLVPLLRVPIEGAFVRGHIFDRSGNIYRFEGEVGQPRFKEGILRSVLENLLFPSILFQILGLFKYYGPHLISVEHVSVEEFKERILAAIQVYEREPVMDCLRDKMKGVGSFAAILDDVEWFIKTDGGREDLL